MTMTRMPKVTRKNRMSKKILDKKSHRCSKLKKMRALCPLFSKLLTRKKSTCGLLKTCKLVISSHRVRSPEARAKKVRLFLLISVNRISSYSQRSSLFNQKAWLHSFASCQSEFGKIFSVPFRILNHLYSNFKISHDHGVLGFWGFGDFCGFRGCFQDYL